MTARILLCLCLLTGCGETLPADTLGRFAHTLGRFAHTLEALKHAYHATCDNREDAAECVVIRENVNSAIDRYTALNDSLKETP